MTMMCAEERTEPLIIHDGRSRFATIGVCWPTAPGFGARHATYLRRYVQSVVVADHDKLEPVSIEWTGEGDVACLTAVLPERIAVAWTGIVVGGLDLEAAGLSGAPTVGVVARPGVASDLGDLVSVSSFSASESLPSSLRRLTAHGHEQIVIVGRDPSRDVGAAATFLAVCLIAAGPGALVPSVVEAANIGATVQFARVLRAGFPALSWTTTTPGEKCQATFDLILSAVARSNIANDVDARARARAFAAGNLNRAWRSPIELARTLVLYEARGWGGSLILNPDAALAGVDAMQLERAIAGTVRPINEVLGRT